MRHVRALQLLVVCMLAVAGCSSDDPSTSSTHTRVVAPAPVEPPAPTGTAGTAADPPLPEVPSPYDALPAPTRALLDEPFTGDFDEMVERRLIRAGVVYNRTQYFIDRGVQRGMVYESVKLLEEEINTRLKTGRLKVHVAVIPLQRDELFPSLQHGLVDFVAAALTITPERRAVAAFSTPTRTGVSEVVVTSPNAEPVTTVNDLSGRRVYVRKSSSYNESLRNLNVLLAARGRPPVIIAAAPESLEDDDLLEMVNAGLVDVTVVDDFVAEFWRQVLPDLRIHPSVTVRTGGEIGVGVRQGNPKLLSAINTWIDEYGPRTAFGNMMEKRYLQSTKYVKNALSDAERRKLRELVRFFQTYGDRYKVDYLLMAAQGFQESGLDQSARSHVGAIGVMQIMPATGRDMAVGDIRRVEPNVHAGVKYFRFMMDEFYKDEPMDELNKGLMTLASYNAGPGRMRQLRAETARRGLNPNVWFGNVERVVSERIGRETVDYVGNIFKYYVAYRLVRERDLERARTRSAQSPSL
jgi:membrane-bound lytic murein transglycosylase MltF